MRIVGMPERFWIVTSPTPVSELGDCCFVCSFKQFALQIRGGLEVESIVGIFADEQLAKDTATRLLTARDAEPSDADTVTFASPWPEWFATQESMAGVFVVNKATGEKVVVEPPREWGRHWAWNFTEDGTGIVMCRTP